MITSFNYAYAVDNNCSINPIHILQIKSSLGCIEDRLDKLENATPVAGGVTTLTSSNSAISLNASSGSVLITPKWQLLCQNTLTVNATSLSCSDFIARKNIVIHILVKIAGTVEQGISLNPSLRFNSDSGTNYTWRGSLNGGADSTGISQNRIDLISGSGSGGGDVLLVECFVYNNLVADNKGVYCLMTGSIASNSANNTFRVETSGKWSNTTTQITTVSLVKTTGTALYQFDTKISIWGYD